MNCGICGHEIEVDPAARRDEWSHVGGPQPRGMFCILEVAEDGYGADVSNCVAEPEGHQKVTV